MPFLMSTQTHLGCVEIPQCGGRAALDIEEMQVKPVARKRDKVVKAKQTIAEGDPHSHGASQWNFRSEGSVLPKRVWF